MLETIIKLVGGYGLAGLLFYLSHISENSFKSFAYFFLAMLVAGAVIISEIVHKHKELEYESRGFIRR